jgi:excisionase family DNA binding protein
MNCKGHEKSETSSNGNKSMQKEQYLTVKEVADLLKVAENTVRGWVKSGELRAIDLGKGWRIAEVDLQFFLDSKQTTPRYAETPPPETEA